MKKIIDTKKLLFENMAKLNPDFKPREELTEEKKEVITEAEKWIQKAVDPKHKGYCTPMSKSTCTPKRKALAKRFKKGIEDEAYGTPDPLGTNMAKPVNEILQNETYFETLSAALDAVKEKVAKKGYTVDEDDMFTQFGTGGIGYGQTKRANIPLLKDGVPQKNRSITIAIYRMDSGKYELTSYIN